MDRAAVMMCRGNTGAGATNLRMRAQQCVGAFQTCFFLRGFIHAGV